jgi:hypothetical protein
MTDEDRRPFAEILFDVIATYTRAEAIRDGVLLDVTEAAKEANLRLPTVVTQSVWRDCVEVPEAVKGDRTLRRVGFREGGVQTRGAGLEGLMPLASKTRICRHGTPLRGRRTIPSN